MKYIYRFFLLLATFLPFAASAQFDEILHPQTTQEIETFRKNKVMAELQKIEDKGEAKNYRARAFDTSGRLLASISYARNQYYLYDEDGRITAYLDSIRNKDDVFTEKAYNFTYNIATGKLEQAQTPDGTVNFSYNAQKKLLTQIYAGNSNKSEFQFDGKGRIISVRSYGLNNMLTRLVERTYSTSDMLHREVQVDYIPGAKDSSIILYVYNDRKQIVKKQVLNFQQYLISKDGGDIPTHSADRQAVGTFTYTYDKSGRKTAEEFVNEKDKFSGYYATWQYNEKGLITKSTYKQAVGEPQIFIYEYGFFE